MSSNNGPLYLGFDLSTQQLKAVLVDSTLRVHATSIFSFDHDRRPDFYPELRKGVLTNDVEHEVYAPVSLWLQALDTVLGNLKKKHAGEGLFERVRGISCAGQQHGSVYWGLQMETVMQHLDPKKGLEEQIAGSDEEEYVAKKGVFAHAFSPNWQDASTQKECDEFDAVLAGQEGGEEALAFATGSKAHHRFTGPQILRMTRKHPEAYKRTSRISLVSSFLATLFLGKFAPIDISDVCGMNLWNIRKGAWDEKLVDLASGKFGAEDLKTKLGFVPEDGGLALGGVSRYFIERYGFSPECTVFPSTGDNPATILALPLREMDVMVSLGTSTTFLMSTPQYKPDPATHFFNSPTTAGLYMFMLCYKNGGLAREHVRDAVNTELKAPADQWDTFNETVLATPPCSQSSPSDPMRLGLYFNRHEIVPNVRAGEWRYNYNPQTKALASQSAGWNKDTCLPDARCIIESQLLSCRLRSQKLMVRPDDVDASIPPQPRRIYLVGGGSRNRAIAQLASEVLGGIEGVYKLDLGENACALGAAYKAVWAKERKEGETFEELIGGRWREEEFVEKIVDGYAGGNKAFEAYGKALGGFEAMEMEVLSQQKKS